MGWLSALFVANLGVLLAASEWVEIPQFSDQRKVYRAPLLHGLVFRQELSGLRNVSEVSGNRGATFSNNQPAFFEHIKSYTTENITSSIVAENNEDTEFYSDEDIATVSSEEELISHSNQLPIIDYSIEDITTTINPIDSTKIPVPMDLLNTSKNYSERNNENEFFDYLPIDLFKRVHRTLKSQPATLKGKIRFLKVFERTLLSEIESRLSAALAPSRMPRKTRDHYDVDYHDDKIGFPSLEGTLIAISFLTFAVYLVRLVMMLFRSTGTVGTTPIVIGRRKRSLHHFDEETARILSYLDSSSSLHY